MRFNLIICLFITFLFSKNNKNPDPIDFNKGFDIKPMLKDGFLINKINKPLSSAEIDLIKDRALKYNPEPISEFDIVLIETSYGLLKAKLFNDIAPKHCLNFKKLANSGFYDETTFHRVIPNFMIQGGDILSRDSDRSNDGTGSPGWTVDEEFNDNKHLRGTLSMARSRDPNSAGSQFFICVDNQPHLDGKYTVFGQLLDLDKSNTNAILNHIANALTESKYVYKISVPALPDGADIDKWIKLTNPKNRKPLYIEIPKGEKKASYKREMLSKLRSDNPIVPIKVKSIRVVKNQQE